MPQSEVPLPPQAPVPDKREIVRLLSNEANQQELFRRADAVRKENVGDEVHLRGLIEFSNICRNNCLYCGIRRGNTHVCRYRMDEAELVETARKAADMGFKTIVMQSGEDMYYTKDRLCRIIAAIKKFDVAITLSIGERTYAEYKAFREAGADRYLMRIETTNKELYHRLDPQMSWQQRYECLLMIKELGYELGSGIMVGLPGQSIESIAEDLLFLRDLPVDMAGIGPFIPHHDTRFANEKAGSVELTLKLLSVIRLLLPKVLLPATTALGTLDPLGREKGLCAGANVVMPNLSPVENRKQYELYDNKICTGDEAAKCKNCLSARVRSAGYELVEDRGDYIG